LTGKDLFVGKLHQVHELLLRTWHLYFAPAFNKKWLTLILKKRTTTLSNFKINYEAHSMTNQINSVSNIPFDFSQVLFTPPSPEDKRIRADKNVAERKETLERIVAGSLENNNLQTPPASVDNLATLTGLNLRSKKRIRLQSLPESIDKTALNMLFAKLYE
jgi:hypothetical protein